MSLRDTGVRKPSTRANTSGAVCGGSAMGKESLATDSRSRNSIRAFTLADIPEMRRIHAANGLPENCFPPIVIKNEKQEDVIDPIFMVNAILEENGRPVMASFLKGTAELYLLVDHDEGTPEQRWEWLQELTEYMKRETWLRGLNEFSAWVPPEIELAFGKRLRELGFVRSPWHSWTLTL